MDTQRKLFWKKVFDAEFVAEKNCWKACNSFCYRWEHPDFNFLFIPRGGTLFYLEEEYEWMQENTKVKKDIKKFTLSFCNKKTSLRYAYCSDCTQCRTLFDRTLYCKLYPFLPIMQLDGTLTNLSFCSVYDITMQFVSSKSPCSILEKNDIIYNKISCNDDLLSILQDPYVLFHLRIAKHIHDNYIENLKKNSKLLSLPIKDFWRKWEIMYLSGNMINKEKLILNVENDYKIMTELYGSFL